MKTLLLSLALFGFFQVKANKIDSIQTDREVLAFLTELIPLGHYDAYGFTEIGPTDCLPFIPDRKSSWKKLDFNGDLATDLFAAFFSIDSVNKTSRYTAYAIVSNGGGKFSYHLVPPYISLFCFAVEPILLNHQPYLLYRYSKFNYVNDRSITKAAIDTLVFKFGGFVNANFKEGRSPEIEAINFELAPGHAAGYSLSISIDKLGKTKFEKSESLHDPAERLQTTLKQKERDELFDLLHYMDLKRVEENFETTLLHQQTGKLEIRFSNGTKKVIKDHGLQGTVSLSHLYDLLFALRKNQDWKKME